MIVIRSCNAVILVHLFFKQTAAAVQTAGIQFDTSSDLPSLTLDVFSTAQKSGAFAFNSRFRS